MGAVEIIGGAVVAERLQDAAPDFLRFVQPRSTLRQEALRRRRVFVQPEDQKRKGCCDAGSAPAARVSAATLQKTVPDARPFGAGPGSRNRSNRASVTDAIAAFGIVRDDTML